MTALNYKDGTIQHVGVGFVQGALIWLVCGLEVADDVNIGCKVDHVLLPTTIGHLNEGLQTCDGGTKNVTYTTDERERERET